MLREIRVYGQLAKFLGRRSFKAAVNSAAEAIRFLITNFPQLERHMADQHYKVIVGTYDLALEELHDPSGMQTIKIIPVIGGAGGNGVGSILAGVALVAFAILAGPAGSVFGLGAAFGQTATFAGGIVGAGFATAVGAIGASLILGGTAQLLTPTPTLNSPGSTKDELSTNNDPRKSYSFSGIQQTSRQGVPVPIVYGETLVGSVVISAGIDTVQVVV